MIGTPDNDQVLCRRRGIGEVNSIVKKNNIWIILHVPILR